jgi:hypothetical protein
MVTAKDKFVYVKNIVEKYRGKELTNVEARKVLVTIKNAIGKMQTVSEEMEEESSEFRGNFNESLGFGYKYMEELADHLNMDGKDHRAFLAKFKQAFGKTYAQWANELIADLKREGNDDDYIRRQVINRWNKSEKISGLNI